MKGQNVGALPFQAHCPSLQGYGFGSRVPSSGAYVGHSDWLGSTARVSGLRARALRGEEHDPHDGSSAACRTGTCLTDSSWSRRHRCCLDSRLVVSIQGSQGYEPPNRHVQKARARGFVFGWLMGSVGWRSPVTRQPRCPDYAMCPHQPGRDHRGAAVRQQLHRMNLVIEHSFTKSHRVPKSHARLTEFRRLLSASASLRLPDLPFYMPVSRWPRLLGPEGGAKSNSPFLPRGFHTAGDNGMHCVCRASR
jgi:hypothetical protein